jgi:hypothetical protein
MGEDQESRGRTCPDRGERKLLRRRRRRRRRWHPDSVISCVLSAQYKVRIQRTYRLDLQVSFRGKQIFTNFE